MTRTAQQAELLLPATAYVESEGTIVNYEGRAQRYVPVYPAALPLRGSWQWLTAAIENCPWQYHDQITAACAAAVAVFADLTQVYPIAHYRIDGAKIPRQPQRYSGRTAMHADVNVREPVQPADHETPFAFSMEGAMAKIPASLQPVIWAPGWNSNQAVLRMQQQLNGPLLGGDPGVGLLAAAGTLPWFDTVPATFQVEEGQWRVVLLPQIFGSEELSMQSEPIIARSPPPYALLHLSDAEKLGIADGAWLQISGLDREMLLRLPLRIETTLTPGLVGIPAGFPDWSWLNAGQRVTLQQIAHENIGEQQQ